VGLALPEDYGVVAGREQGRGYSNKEADRQILGQQSESPVEALFDPVVTEANQKAGSEGTKSSTNKSSDDSPRGRAIIR